jgi:hypothetical protein
MAKSEKRIEARRLRRKGLSIRSISEGLRVSKSSISIWCKDIEMTPRQKEVLFRKAVRAGHKGRMIGAEMNRKKKERRISFHKKSGKRDIGSFSKRDFLMAGIALYWGEGSKTSKLSFSNSDPDMIYFMYRWLQEVMGVQKKDIVPRIFINEIHQPRVRKVLKFWSHLLNVPNENFKKTILIKTRQKKIYENYHDYYGVLTLRVKKGTDLRYRILGLIDALRDKTKKPV